MKRIWLKTAILALSALMVAACGVDESTEAALTTAAGEPATTAAPVTTAPTERRSAEAAAEAEAEAAEAAEAAREASEATEAAQDALSSSSGAAMEGMEEEAMVEEAEAATQSSSSAAAAAPTTTRATAEALRDEEEEESRREKPVIREFPLVFYEGYGVNPQIPADEQPFSTFGLDADTASWYRQFVYLDQGARPNPDAIRAEEMINAFDARCDESVSDGIVRLCVQGTQNPFYLRDEYRLVRVAVETGRGFNQPVTYIVVLDQSGSMGDGDRWDVATTTLEDLLDSLNSDDRFGLVTFHDHAHVIVHPEYGDQARRQYREANLYPDGSTNAGEGLRMGYELAYDEARRDSDRQVMVVFLSDGVANTGPATGPDSILELVERAKRDSDISMAAGGVGEGNYNDVLLEQIADQAQGWYQYIYDYRSADRFLDKVLSGIVGWEAKAQVEFNPEAVDLWRLIGYENRKIGSDLFREDELVKSQSAPLLGGVATAAFFEVKLNDGAERRDWLASATVRYRPCLDCYFKELNTRTPVGAVDVRFTEGACDYRVQAYVMQYAEFARSSFYAWERNTPEALLDALYRDLDSLYQDERGSCEQNLETVARTVRKYINASPLETSR